MGLKKTTVVHDIVSSDHYKIFLSELDKRVEDGWKKVGGMAVTEVKSLDNKEMYTTYYILVEKEITVH